MAKGIMYVDNIRVEFDDEPTIMDVCRKAGVEMPNFCFHSDLSVYGACRMCLDRAAVVDGRSAQIDQNGRGGVLRHDADAQRAGQRALIGQNQVLERNIQRAVCRGEVDMVLGERRE